MAEGTVRVQIRAHARFQRGRGIGDDDRFCIPGNGRLRQRRREQIQMVQRPQLVVAATGGGIGKQSIELVGLESEHASRARIVTRPAICPAGERPCLRTGSSRGSNDGNHRAVPVRQQISIRTVRPPAIRHPIINTIIAIHQETRFHAPPHRRIAIIHRQIELFHQDRSFGELPGTRDDEVDFFRCGISQSVVGNRQPALFGRVVRPERRVYVIRDQPTSRTERGQVAESLDLGKQCGRLRRAARPRSGRRQFVIEKFPNRSEGVQTIDLSVAGSPREQTSQQAGEQQAPVGLGRVGQGIHI